MFVVNSLVAGYTLGKAALNSEVWQAKVRLLGVSIQGSVTKIMQQII